MRSVTGVALVLALAFSPLGLLWLAVCRHPVLRLRTLALAGRLSPLRRSRVPDPTGRPLETIVADVRRLGLRHRTLHPHAAFAKVQAVQSAYDRALAELCTALGITHLLGVLEPGADLDHERERVEHLVDTNGVSLPHAA